MAVEWGKEVGRGRRGRTEVCSLGLRTGVSTPTTYRQLIPLGGYNQGQVASWHWRNDDGELRYGKKPDTQRRLRWKVMFLSLWLKWRAAPVTFSPASHHSVLFFILSGNTSASKIRDLLVLSSLSEPCGAQPFHQCCNETQSEILLKRQKRTLLYKGPKETLPYMLLWINHHQMKRSFQNAAGPCWEKSLMYFIQYANYSLGAWQTFYSERLTISFMQQKVQQH